MNRQDRSYMKRPKAVARAIQMDVAFIAAASATLFAAIGLILRSVL